MFKTIDEIVMHFPVQDEYSKTMFLDLLHGMLQIDPTKRFSALDARNHPFFELRL
jgi:serine/threonine protein kinase